MRWRRTQEGGSRHRGGCLYLLCILLLAMAFGCCAPLGGAYVTLWAMKQDQAEVYRAFARDVFGVSPKELGAEYFLTEEGRALAEEAGLDPDRLARALYIEEWLDKLKGAEYGDWSVYYELTSEESAGCINCGMCVAWVEYDTHNVLTLETQGPALRKLVDVWKRWELREHNPIAAKYLPEDYDPRKIIGSCGGGALGCSQFIPMTAIIHLEEIGEPFDLWDPDTAMKVMALELYRLGWRENLPFLKRVMVLLGWNRHQVWVTGIAKGATNLRASFGQVRGCIEVRKSFEAAFVTTEDIKVSLLTWVGLMPEVSAAELSPMPEAVVDATLLENGEVIIEHSFSIRAQGDANTDFNIRKIVGDRTPGVTDYYSDFVGAVRLEPGNEPSMNALFGNYSYRRGFKTATGEEGGGACNFMALLWYVAETAGLDCNADRTGHPQSPGVPAKYNPRIWHGSQDLRVTNNYDFPVYIRWTVEGDTLTLAVIKGESAGEIQNEDGGE